MQPKLYFEHSDLGHAYQELREVVEHELPMEATLKGFLEAMMVEERADYLAAGPHERTPERRDWANGCYERDLGTRYGLVRGLRVPRVRGGGFRPRVLRRYARRQETVNGVIRGIYLAGVSTRRVGPCVKGLLGEAVSASTVSRICAGLTRQVQAYHQRALTDHYRYLFLDGLHFKVRGALASSSARGRKRTILLCAMGIGADGRRELIAFRRVKSESEAAWTAFLNDLYQRGLHGRSLRLIITDGCAGLRAALDVVYPFAGRQRCWFHKMRNVVRHVRKRDQQALTAGARAIYHAATRRAAIRAFWQWAGAWRRRAPKAVACVEDDLDALLAHFSETSELRRTLRTTNPLERSFREVRRRTRPMTVMNNDDSIERVTYSVFHHLNTQWEKHPLWPSTQNS